MPTSASTGTEQVSTSGKGKAAAKSTGAETQTPDGAPVVTRPEDVVAGVRVNIPPDTPDSLVEAAPQGGVAEIMRPDGSIAMLDSNDEDFDEHAEDVRTGKKFV